MKKITYSKQAIKSLRKMANNNSVKIVNKINAYARKPENFSNVVITMKNNSGLKRMRVGNYRIIFSENNIVIAIELIKPRGKAYK